MNDFSTVNMDEKLNLLMVAINKMNTNFHHKLDDLNKQLNEGDNAIVTRLATCETAIKTFEETLNDEQEGALPRLWDPEQSITDLIDRVEKLEEENIKVRDELYTLQGIAQVHDNKIHQTEKKITDLTVQNMKNNVLIRGVTGDTGNFKENCKEKVLALLRDKMAMDVQDREIIVAHRMGYKKSASPCTIVARCEFSLRDRIFDYTKNLKGHKNDDGDFYKITPHLPEPLYTQKKEHRERIIEIKKCNEQMDDPNKQIKIEVKSGILHLNGKAQKKHIHPLTVRDLLTITPEQQNKINSIQFMQSTLLKEKGSSFIGYAAKINNTSDICNAYLKAKQTAPDADHVMMAYAVKHYTGHHDDGEHGASKKIASILSNRNAMNIIVFVARQYGGLHLGPKRFIYIEKAAREALNQL